MAIPVKGRNGIIDQERLCGLRQEHGEKLWRYRHADQAMRRAKMGRGILLWLLGVPIPVIILLWLIFGH